MIKRGTKFDSTEEMLNAIALEVERDECLAKGVPFDEAEFRKRYNPADWKLCPFRGDESPEELETKMDALLSTKH